MIEKICNLSVIASSSRMKSCRMKVEDKNARDDIDFNKIVKFLNDQKAAMDYADLN